MPAPVVDANVLIRHLTGEPPEMAARATAFLRDAKQLLLSDVVFAECVFVLGSVYEQEPARIAELLRALLGLHGLTVTNRSLLERALELFELTGVDFVDAYCVALAELSGAGAVASFDRDVERTGTVRRIEP
jgi:predicted nucleic acid-binding protein